MAMIFGRVIHAATRRGIQRGQVTATSKTVSKSAITDIDGKYEILDLSPGDYTLQVKATGFTTALLSPPGPPVVRVDVNDVEHNFLMHALSITGRVTKEADAPVKDAVVTATHSQTQAKASEITDDKGEYAFLDLAKGIYTVSVEGYLAAHNVAVVFGATAEGIDFSLDVVKDFLDRLDDARFSIESPISIFEADQAVSLFSVVNLLLAGMSRRKVGADEKIDVLGVLELYYGLQDRSLQNKITVADSQNFWGSIEAHLIELAKELDQLQSDVDFLNREAKRQFNLGTSNDVLANVEFPRSFKRYVEISTDPLLAIDIRAEDKPNAFLDKTKIAQADDLLKELKGLILQVVRSLSKYGTAATKRVNEDWARFQARALEVIAIVAQNRVTPDLDEKNIWSALALLTGRNRETQVAPHVVLARNGGNLLQEAMDIYRETQDQLDEFDRDHLRDLFQPQGKEFRTTRLRKEATIIKRYPLSNWA